ncbi:MAG TPA: PAS domain-containing protein [Methylocystis sp.]|nr:PAS domain-containing protein [Methylocystis sp.]
MRQAVSKGIYAYWNCLRGERAAPERSDIDPAAIRDLLPDAFLIEIDPGCRFPIRLFGTRLAAQLLEDHTGASFLELWREEDRRTIAAALLTVIDGVTPVVGGAKVQKRDDRSGCDGLVDLELLLLPLRHNGKTHSRALGALSVCGSASWLGRARAAPLQLSSLRVLEAANTGRARALPPGGRVLRREPGVRQLVVYKGGKSA